MERKLFKKTDLIIIAVLLIAVILLYFIFFGKSNNNYNKITAHIFVDGKEYRVIELSDKTPDETIHIDAKLPVTLQIKQGKIGFIDVKCPDKVCEKSGFINKPNQTAVCLPAKVSIQIIGD